MICISCSTNVWKKTIYKKKKKEEKIQENLETDVFDWLFVQMKFAWRAQ